MKLSKPAILALRGLDQESKERISDTLKVHLTTFYRWITDNKTNGPLTTVAAQNAIRVETGLNDTDLLEEEAVMGEQN